MSENLASETELSIESESVAAEKLERLMAEDFTSFAIRFVNEGEYENILKIGVFGQNEVAIPKSRLEKYQGKDAPSFGRYLKESVGSWDAIAAEQTDWGTATMGMSMYKRLLELLSQARKEIKQEQGTKDNYRQEVLERMRDMLRADKVLAPEQYYAIDFALSLENIENELSVAVAELENNLPEKQAQELLATIEKEVSEGDEVITANIGGQILDKIKDFNLFSGVSESVGNLASKILKNKLIIGALGKENLRLIKEWMDDPAGVDLRSLCNAVAYNQSYRGQEWGPASSKEQYHMALVIALEALVSEGAGGLDDWCSLQGGPIKDHLLAAICVMPNKELLEKEIELVSAAGQNSHPVFDNQGRIRFPRNKS